MFLSPEEVDVFKDDVKDKPGKETSTKKKQRKNGPLDEETHDETSCADRWTANKASAAADETVQTFEQTGIFILACRHGIVETVRKCADLVNCKSLPS